MLLNEILCDQQSEIPHGRGFRQRIDERDWIGYAVMGGFDEWPLMKDC